MSNRPKKRFGRHTEMKNTSLIQNTLPAWNLPLKKKRWKYCTEGKNVVNMSDDGTCFSTGNLIPTVSVST